MTLPAPNLDDRRFQEIVDEAKRLIPRYCPDWTDHNVSDPGIALVELLAWMSEMIIYRLNQVPDRLYIKFLELIGVEPFSAAPARTDLLFLLAGRPADAIRIPASTQVATGGSGEEPVVFMTDSDLLLRRPTVEACVTRASNGTIADVWDGLRTRTARVPCFPTVTPGDAFYLGFTDSLAGNLLRIDVRASAEGAGIRPEDPPRQWQAWDGSNWRLARLLSDTSEGFNTEGSITLLVPPRHEAAPVGQVRAHWVRCRLMPPEGDQRPYDRSPLVDEVAVVGLGGAVSAHHAEPAPAEMIGLSNGQPGQVFQVRRAPVLPRHADEYVKVVTAGRVAEADGGQLTAEDWTEVLDFSNTGPNDRVYVWSPATGEIRFPPHLRQPPLVHGQDERVGIDGMRHYGAVPPADAQIWVTGYRYGGGRRGNVGARTLTSLRTSIPSVSEVYNLDAASGGVDAETMDNAKVRGPMQLRGGDRAVTAADFERLTLQAARGVARAHCVPPGVSGEPVQVLVVPRVDIPPELLELDDLDLPEELEKAIIDYLEQRRMLTMQVVVEKPSYLGVRVAARVRAAASMRSETVRAGCESALHGFINPVVGGPQGAGWPFRRDCDVIDVGSVLLGVPGVERVEEVVFFHADLTKPRPRRVSEERFGNVIRLPNGSLFASGDHRVHVVQ